eukprot:SAG11_NODE_521_length_8777_cov_17.940770_3_plen_93_part_00
MKLYTSHPNIENTTHSFVTIETLDLWNNLTNDDNIETVDLWKIPYTLIMIPQKRSTYGESLISNDDDGGGGGGGVGGGGGSVTTEGPMVSPT